MYMPPFPSRDPVMYSWMRGEAAISRRENQDAEEAMAGAVMFASPMTTSRRRSAAAPNRKVGMAWSLCDARQGTWNTMMIQPGVEYGLAEDAPRAASSTCRKENSRCRSSTAAMLWYSGPCRLLST